MIVDEVLIPLFKNWFSELFGVPKEYTFQVILLSQHTNP